VIAERFKLASDSPEEVRSLAREIRSLSGGPAELDREVREILGAVYQGGDAALVELTRRFDSERAPDELRVPTDELRRARDTLDAEVREAIELAIENVSAVCGLEQPRAGGTTLAQGQRVELKEVPVARAGVYVPGGRAAYPSSAVMCCVPARAAGVREIAVTTPPGDDGRPNPIVLAACALCGVEEVYSIGGAQAVAALAFGTTSVPPVDVIVGPGNLYVQEAKRQVFGIVGIDGINGPSEVVVIADADAPARLIALDVAAQSEHGADSLLALATPYEFVIEAVIGELRTMGAFEKLAHAPLALVDVPSLDAAVTLANEIAPEHLELLCADAERLAAGVRTSGCVFLGMGGGTAFGDYVAGSDHVLPTGGAARFAGPLGASTFRRTQALVSLPAAATRALAGPGSKVAYAEGFPLHAQSMLARESLDGTPDEG
jgi:histidinol dehydrogenase